MNQTTGLTRQLFLLLTSKKLQKAPKSSAFSFAHLQKGPKSSTQGATQASGCSLLAGALLTPLSLERWQAPNNGDRPVLSISRPNPARPAAQPRNIATPAKNAPKPRR